MSKPQFPFSGPKQDVGRFRRSGPAQSCASVVSAEDLVATKVLAGRPRDLDHVVTILHVRGPDIDWHRIRTTLGLLEGALARRDLLTELERLMVVAREAEPPPRV